VPSYFVFFVVDDVDDELAREIRIRVRKLAAARAWRNPPGFFDDPGAGDAARRTTGGYLRVEADTADGDDVRAVCAAVQALSRDHEVDVELQWREAILGRVRRGVPDDGLEEALTAATGETRLG
jgi:alkylhydroperoxidase family enzyme